MIIIRYALIVYLLLGSSASKSHGQGLQPTFITIGDSAPPLRVHQWIKGTPVDRFEKGHVYVVEFWATWCKPCIAMMPHLSELARQYKNQVTIIGIDIKERKNTTLKWIKSFVDSMGQSMDYLVAVEDTAVTVADWLEATGEQNNGIPRTFVIDREGKLAWIGHPSDLETVLKHVINKSWDFRAFLNQRNEKRRLEELDFSLLDTLNKYAGFPGKPDSALLVINHIVTKEPKLTYAPRIAHRTFFSLLLTNPDSALAYGESLLVTPTYEDPAYDVITGNIEWLSNKVNLPAQVYALGAKAYKAKIDRYARFGNLNISKSYQNMAAMYFRANMKAEAISVLTKEIQRLKQEKSYSKKDVASLQLQLQQYNKIK